MVVVFVREEEDVAELLLVAHGVGEARDGVVVDEGIHRHGQEAVQVRRVKGGDAKGTFWPQREREIKGVEPMPPSWRARRRNSRGLLKEWAHEFSRIVADSRPSWGVKEWTMVD
jgi:hypothetical protein